MDRCALFVDAGYVLADGAMAVHGTRNRESVSWDYAGVIAFLGTVARERTGLPLLRCYWYEATVESRRTPEHDALADLPGVKLRLGRMRPGRREGVESEIHRDLTTLARNGAVSDALVVSAEEDLAQVIADVQDLGVRVCVVHITVDGNWTISRALRQECDDIIEIGDAHLRPYVELVVGAEPAGDEPAPADYAARRARNGHAPVGSLTQPALPAGALPAEPGIYTAPVVAEYQRAAQPQANGHPGQVVPPAPGPGPTTPADPAQRPQAADRRAGQARAGQADQGQPGAHAAPGRPAQQGAMQPPGAMPQGLAGQPVQPGVPGQQQGQQGLGGQPGASVPGMSGRPDMASPGVAEPPPGQPVLAPQPSSSPERSRRQGLPQRTPSGQQPGIPPSPASAAPSSPSVPGGMGQPPGMQVSQPMYPAPPPAGYPVPGQDAPGGQGLPGGHPMPGAHAGSGPAGQVPALPPASPQHHTGPRPYPPGRYGGGQPDPRYPAGPGQPDYPAGQGQPDYPGVPGQPDPRYAGAPGQPDPRYHAAPGQPDPRYPAAPGLPSARMPGPPYVPQQGPYGGPQSAAHPVPVPPPPTVSVADAVQSAHGEGFKFGQAVAREAPALWLEAVLARKPRMPSDLEARLLQDSSLPIDSLLHDEVRHALRRGFWDGLERSRR